MVGRPVSYSLSAAGLPATATGTSLVSIRGTLPKDADGRRASLGQHGHLHGLGPEGAAHTQVHEDRRRLERAGVEQRPGRRQCTGDQVRREWRPHRSPTSRFLRLRSTTSSEPSAGPRTASPWASATPTIRLACTSRPVRPTSPFSEQNGNDGENAAGVVTGIHMTTDGPQLVIGGHNIPLASISDIQS